MRNPKTWNYAEVTKEAEQLITELMTKSHQDPDPTVEKLLRQWAYGAYILWDRLTRGWQNEGDGARMEALTRLSEQVLPIQDLDSNNQ